MRKIAILTLAGALALSACNRKPADEPQPANNMIEVPEETIPANEDEAPAAEVPNNTAIAKPAPEPTISETQQMQDDADATGMTARLPDESSGVPMNQVRPAE